MKKVAFLVSGSGTNMDNLLRHIREGKIEADPVVVISNRPAVKALERAAARGVPTEILDHTLFETREAFDQALSDLLRRYEPDIICLAGFMRILTEAFVRAWWGRLINIHPALLPAFPGAHAIRDAYEAGVSETGVTVHFVDYGVDTGPIILQKKVQRFSEDTLESLEERIHITEYEIYPEALKKVLSGEVKTEPSR